MTLKISSTTITLEGRSEHFMFGGHVKAQDGASDLEHLRVITPIVRTRKILIVMLSVGHNEDFIAMLFMSTLQEALTHKSIYIYAYVYIYSIA